MALQTQVETPIHSERHFAPAEIAAMWNLSPDKVRELFRSESGVLAIGERPSRYRRRYVTLRIPESVLRRWVVR
jgi:hypothetical protein